MATLDPRVKILLVGVVSTLAIVFQDLRILLVLFVTSLLLTVCFRIQIASLFFRLRHFLGLFIFIVTVQSIFTRKGTVLLNLFNVIIITEDGILMGLSVFLRLLVVICISSILSTSKSTELVNGLTFMGLPYEISFMVFMGIRFLPLLKDTIKDSYVALQLTGVDFRKISFKERISLSAYIFLPAVITAMERARIISAAAEARGFRIYNKRSFYKRPVMSWLDWCLAASLGICCVTLLLLKGLGVLY